MNIRGITAATVLLATIALASTEARAQYSFSTSVAFGAPIGASGTVVNTPGSGASFTTVSGTVIQVADIHSSILAVPSVITVDLGTVVATTTAPTADTFTVPYTDVITVTNPSPGGSTGTFTVTGTLTASGVSFVGGVTSGTISNQYNSPFTQSINVGGTPFVLFLGTGAKNDYFAPPTINNPGHQGALGGQITAGTVSSVPEPSALALLGALTVPAGALLRRRRA